MVQPYKKCFLSGDLWKASQRLHSVYYSSPHCTMRIGKRGSLPFTGAASHFRTVNMLSASKTWPNTTCLPSSQSALPQVIKNWHPFVFGPLLALDRRPGRSCLCRKFSSGKEVAPYMLIFPEPSWLTKSANRYEHWISINSLIQRAPS
jgi:hypothetical protein